MPALTSSSEQNSSSAATSSEEEQQQQVQQNGANSPDAPTAPAGGGTDEPPAAKKRRLSQHIASLVCCAAETRFHPEVVAAAWGRARKDPDLKAALAQLDDIAQHDAKAAGRRRRGADGGDGGGEDGCRGPRVVRKRGRNGYHVALALAVDAAAGDAEVAALLAQLPAPKGGEAGSAVLPVVARTAAWGRIPEGIKEALVAPCNSLCAKLGHEVVDTASPAALRAALKEHCKVDLKQPPPDVWRHYKPNLLEVLRARLSNEAAAAAAARGGGGASGATAPTTTKPSKPGKAGAPAAVAAAAEGGKEHKKHKKHDGGGGDKEQGAKKHKKHKGAP